MVKTRSKAEYVDKEKQQKEVWSMCSLSMEPLKTPLAGCGLGRLYNKEAILTFLLDPASYPESRETFAHISSLKDVVTLSVTRNQTDAEGAAEFVCPITGREMNGKFRFFFHKECGCVLSEQALKELGADSEACLRCGKAVHSGSRTPINGTLEEVELLRTKLKARLQKGSSKGHPPKRKIDEANLNGPKALSRAALSELPGEIITLKRTKNIASLYKAS